MNNNYKVLVWNVNQENDINSSAIYESNNSNQNYIGSNHTKNKHINNNK